MLEAGEAGYSGTEVHKGEQWQKLTFTQRTTLAETKFSRVRFANATSFCFALRNKNSHSSLGWQVKADCLVDESAEESAILLAEGEKSETTQHYRDVLKSCVIKRDAFAYANATSLPRSLTRPHQTRALYQSARSRHGVRCAAVRQDAFAFANATSLPRLTYVKHTKLAPFLQRNFCQRDHHEFLSSPVITLVVYFGDQRWDAPRSVHQMFDQTYDERLLRFVPDYKINLLEPAALSDEDLTKFTTDFGRVMEFLQCANDKQRMQQLLREGSPFESISTSAALVLNSCANIKIRINQDEEKTDMCKAIQELKQEAVDEACKALQEIQQEAIEKAVGEAVEKEQKKQQEAVAKTAVNSLLKTARALMETLHLSAEQALNAMKVSESECATLKPMLQG